MRTSAILYMSIFRSSGHGVLSKAKVMHLSFLAVLCIAASLQLPDTHETSFVDAMSSMTRAYSVRQQSIREKACASSAVGILTWLPVETSLSSCDGCKAQRSADAGNGHSKAFASFSDLRKPPLTSVLDDVDACILTACWRKPNTGCGGETIASHEGLSLLIQGMALRGSNSCILIPVACELVTCTECKRFWPHHS